MEQHSFVNHNIDRQHQENHWTNWPYTRKTLLKSKIEIICIWSQFYSYILISEMNWLRIMVVYRTSMQIMADLLTATEESGQQGIKTTSLLLKANLSHSRLERFVSNLTGAGLVNKIQYDGKHVFVITPKGTQYLEQYKKFANVAESFGLEM